MTRKKIYFLINSLGAGGAERVVSNLATNLSRTHDVTIITLKADRFFDLPGNVKHLPLSRTNNNLVMVALIPWFYFQLRRLLPEYDNWVSFLEISNFLHILARKDAMISFRIHIGFFRGFAGSVYRLLIKFLYPKAGKIIVNSEENRYDLAEYLNIPLDRIVTIYNPISIATIEQKKQEPLEDWILEKTKGKKVFVTTGRLEWQKHHEVIIRAFQNLYKSGERDFIWFIIGDWWERHRLEKMVLEYSLQENILFLGTQQNVFKYLGIANYFIYASEIEWFPNVLIEAMACNLPIITSDFKSGARESVLGEYNKNTCKNLKYPYFWSNGVLLDLNRYEYQFLDIYKKTNELKQERAGFENFNTETIIKKWTWIFTR